jgi:hypothetical protein
MKIADRIDEKGRESIRFVSLFRIGKQLRVLISKPVSSANIPLLVQANALFVLLHHLPGMIILNAVSRSWEK